MPYLHEGATDKINDLKRERGWKPGKAQRFHHWLTKAYPDTKDSMSYAELRRVALEFERQDRDRWDD